MNQITIALLFQQARLDTVGIKDNSSTFFSKDDHETSVTTKDLQAAYQSAAAKGKLIDLTKTLRDDVDGLLKHEDLIALFKGLEDWDKPKQSTGHVKFKNRLTGISVGFSGHGNPVLATHEKKALLETIQEHLNILCNDIFKYKTKNWKEEKDPEQSLKNYKNWCKNKGGEKLSVSCAK